MKAITEIFSKTQRRLTSCYKLNLKDCWFICFQFSNLLLVNVDWGHCADLCVKFEYNYMTLNTKNYSMLTLSVNRYPISLFYVMFFFLYFRIR